MRDRALCCLAPGSDAREGTAAGIPIWGWLWGLLCPVFVPSRWTVGFAPLSQDAQCLVLWEVGVGYSAEAQQCPSHEVYHRQLVSFFLLHRTGINLQRSQFTVLFKTHAVAHFWLCSTAVEALAVLQTSATWTAMPRTGCRTQVLCWEAVLLSGSGLEIQPPPPPCLWVAQGKA